MRRGDIRIPCLGSYNKIHFEQKECWRCLEWHIALLKCEEISAVENRFVQKKKAPEIRDTKKRRVVNPPVQTSPRVVQLRCIMIPP